MDSEYSALSFRDFEGNARKILGVGDFAEKEDIQKAFRALALKFHPDRCGKSLKCILKFRAVMAAYEWLTKGTADKEAIPLLKNPQSLRSTRRRETYLNWWQRTYYDDVAPNQLESTDANYLKKKKKKEQRRFPL